MVIKTKKPNKHRQKKILHASGTLLLLTFNMICNCGAHAAD